MSCKYMKACGIYVRSFDIKNKTTKSIYHLQNLYYFDTTDTIYSTACGAYD